MKNFLACSLNLNIESLIKVLNLSLTSSKASYWVYLESLFGSLGKSPSTIWQRDDTLWSAMNIFKSYLFIRSYWYLSRYFCKHLGSFIIKECSSAIISRWWSFGNFFLISKAAIRISGAVGLLYIWPSSNFTTTSGDSNTSILLLWVLVFLLSFIYKFSASMSIYCFMMGFSVPLNFLGLGRSSIGIKGIWAGIYV